MKKTCYLILLLGICLASCTSYKRIPYIQNSDELKNIVQEKDLYDAHIMPKDLLTITVNCEDPEAAAPYNLVVQSILNNNSKTLTTQPSLMSYLVDNNGNIDFPSLGTIHVGGLTKSQAEEMIRQRLQPYFSKKFIVNVRMINYKISVLGEVARPNTYTISNEKVNIFEALALAGDLTIYGKRDGVKLIREDSEGKTEIIPLNLNDANIVNSPYYYLRQNDVLYVEPNKAKAKNSDIGQSTTLWFSATSIMISLTSLLYNILN
ncbi:MAG: polysaccharide biosynthesis/export family protein [Bacteroidaceae bacterium]|nr:polysaccharide biosynthesis/export family protein [Bacteroidaceae bacterium]